MKPPVETLKGLLLKITRVNLGQNFLVYVFQRHHFGELIFEQKIFSFFFSKFDRFLNKNFFEIFEIFLLNIFALFGKILMQI